MTKLHRIVPQLLLMGVAILYVVLETAGRGNQ
jgi:hypothetical protein